MITTVNLLNKLQIVWRTE